MDVSHPHAAVVPSLDGDVLAVLAGTTRPLTGREVSRLARRGSPAGVIRALQRLAAHGLVTTQPAGRATLFSLNREHLAAPAVEQLAGLRAELFRRVGETLRRWTTPPMHVSVFGSAARGDGDTASDIDVLLVRPTKVAADDPTWRAQVSALADAVQRWTGNRLSVAEVSSAELTALRSRRPRIVEDLERDAVTLAGPDARQLLRRVR